MALTLLAANNAQTVLAAGISSSATSITVNTGTGALFPAPVSGTSYFKLTLVDAATGSLTEIVHVTARAGDVFTIQRAREGTTARAWSANDIAANMMTAGTLDVMAQKDLSLQIANSLSEIAAAGTEQQARGYLGFDAMGIGAQNSALTNVNWQNFQFVNGASYQLNASNWLNPPSPLEVFTTGTIAVNVMNMSGDIMATSGTPWMHFLAVNYSTNGARRIFQGVSRGPLNGRIFHLEELFTDARTVPVANGGTGATTVNGALSNLGFTFGTNWIKFPSGHILQYGSAGGFDSYTVVLPVPYSTNNYTALAGGSGSLSGGDAARVFVETGIVDNGSFTAVCINAAGARNARGINWITFGK